MINIAKVINIAKQAGKIILSFYAQSNIETLIKSDQSPVTIADIEANKFICNQLKELYPNIPIISEENEIHKNNLGQEFWLIDPLDGTKSFINKEDEFTVNISLINGSTPVIGIIYIPVKDTVYYVDIDNIPYKQIGSSIPTIISTRAIPKDGLTALISTSINKTQIISYFQNNLIKDIIPTGSALKLCLIAEGKADIYPRFGRTMEWDIAAGHAILSAAGGSVKDLNGNDLTYGNIEREFANPNFIAQGYTVSP